MGLWKKISELFGSTKDDERQHDAVNDTDVASSSSAVVDSVPAQYDRRRGFSVPVQVPVDRVPLPPLLLPCPSGDGGVQGLNWYANRLKIDEDGDVADEFLVEVLPDSSTSIEDHNRPLPRFEVKYNTKRATVRGQMLLPNGKIQHQVENQGKVEWV